MAATFDARREFRNNWNRVKAKQSSYRFTDVPLHLLIGYLQDHHEKASWRLVRGDTENIWTLEAGTATVNCAYAFAKGYAAKDSRRKG